VAVKPPLPHGKGLAPNRLKKRLHQFGVVKEEIEMLKCNIWTPLDKMTQYFLVTLNKTPEIGGRAGVVPPNLLAEGESVDDGGLTIDVLINQGSRPFCLCVQQQ